jgi:hypothetical protein
LWEVVGLSEKKDKAEEDAKKVGEAAGKGVKKGVKLIKGFGKGVKKGIKGEDEEDT